VPNRQVFNPAQGQGAFLQPKSNIFEAIAQAAPYIAQGMLQRNKAKREELDREDKQAHELEKLGETLKVTESEGLKEREARSVDVQAGVTGRKEVAEAQITAGETEAATERKRERIGALGDEAAKAEVTDDPDVQLTIAAATDRINRDSPDADTFEMAAKTAIANAAEAQSDQALIRQAIQNAPLATKLEAERAVAAGSPDEAVAILQDARRRGAEAKLATGGDIRAEATSEANDARIKEVLLQNAVMEINGIKPSPENPIGRPSLIERLRANETSVAEIQSNLDTRLLMLSLMSTDAAADEVREALKAEYQKVITEFIAEVGEGGDEPVNKSFTATLMSGAARAAAAAPPGLR